MATDNSPDPTTEKASSIRDVQHLESGSPGSGSGNERDERDLADWGYKQELKRDWGLMHNFGISFSIIVREPLDLITLSEELRLTTC